MEERGKEGEEGRHKGRNIIGTGGRVIGKEGGEVGSRGKEGKQEEEDEGGGVGERQEGRQVGR